MTQWSFGLKILLAGIINTPKTQHTIEYIKNSSLGVLHSVLNEPKKIEKYDLGNFLIVDSGAHSWNKLTIQKFGHGQRKNLPDPIEFYKSYAEFIEKHKDKPFTFVELDIYGVLKKDIIDDFYKQISSIKGNHKFIRVYHPIIDDGKLIELKKWIDQGQDYIGIGNDSRSILNNVFKITKNNIKLHGFAMTSKILMEKYPFYTCDSTTWLSGAMYSDFYDDKKLKIKSLTHLKKNKDINIINTRKFHTNYGVNHLRVIGMQKLQNYINKLWQQRGITWE